MRNWLYILIGILVLMIVTYVLGNKRREGAKNKLKELRDERQKLWCDTKQKERLRYSLNKKLNVLARLTSIVMIFSFISASIAAGLLSMGKIDIATALVGAGIVEFAIVVTSQLYIHNPYEIKYYLGRIEPYLRGKFFANHQNLNEEIESGHKRIEIIDTQIQRLQRIIAV